MKPTQPAEVGPEGHSSVSQRPQPKAELSILRIIVAFRVPYVPLWRGSCT
jgi:hypothetical protein